MIRSAITRLFGGAPQAAAQEPVQASADVRGAPGTRVHHEFFIDEPDSSGAYRWLCRVYAQNGAATEREGVAESRDGAQSAALSWAAKTKAALRGEA